MFSRSLSSYAIFRRAVVFGGGTMGGGIAQTIAAQKIPTVVIDLSDASLSKCKQTIQGTLDRMGKKMADTIGQEGVTEWKTQTLANLTFTSDIEGAMKVTETDIIIEAIVEDLKAKQTLWAQLDLLAPKHCIFCTNTSSLSVTEQASVTKRADRFAGLHFFSPVTMMKLVEVVQTDSIDANVFQQLIQFVRELQKEPVVCRDTKGFIVNRLLVPFMLEAARMVERGDATVQDIDKAMRLGAGHPMGPFTLADSVGNDVIHHINTAWHIAEPHQPLFDKVPLFETKVKEGKLGRKTKEGFYDYKH